MTTPTIPRIGQSSLKAKFVLDGEVTVFDKDLVSRFEWKRGRPDDEPATLPVFDILELNGRNPRPKPMKRTAPCA
jgi:ATP-dependent DNA ligase